jgi:hypothetical protein
VGEQKQWRCAGPFAGLAKSPRSEHAHNYMHFNPVKRGLVSHAKEWHWSNYRFYWKREAGICTPNPEWKFKQTR